MAACLGLGMLMIDTFVVNVAFPAIGRSMHASLSAAEWTVSGYVLAVGVLPIAMGRAGDIFGRRRIYLAGLILFLVASAASGTSQTIEQLILCRVLQGIGAATMMPGTLSIITQAFPPQQRGLAIGIWGGVSGLGLIAGPILGGLLVHGDSWRWIFYINLPIGVAAVAMTLLFVPESRDESAARSLDLAGVALLSAPLLLVMYAITRANDLGWTSPQIVGCFVGAAALVPMFIVTERRVANPLIDLTLFRSRTFVFACLSAFLFSATVFGAQPYTSLFMQNFWGFSPLKGGVAFLPSTVVVAGLMPVSGILGQRLGTKLRFFLLFAAVAVASSFILQLRLTTASGYLDGFLPSFLLRGLGIGLFMSATSYAVVSSMPVSKSGLASGTLTMSRNIGTSLGVAVFGAVFLHSIDGNLPARLDGVSTQSPAVVAAAEHFVPAGDPSGGTHAIAADEIVHGFVLICGAAVVTCVLASGAAFAVRPRALEAASEVAPAALAVEADAGT